MTATKEAEEKGGPKTVAKKTTAKKTPKAEPEEKPLTLEEVRAVLAEKSRKDLNEKNGGNYMISKKLTSKAGITIPKALRADLGWQPSMAVDLAPQEDGSLIIRPHIDLCRFCGTHENVHKYKDVCVCSECSVKMKEAI